MLNLLVGQNNTGKSNFLRAINIALARTSDISETDIFVAADERLEKSKSAVIDIMFQPINDDGEIVADFSDFWTGVFTEAWITTHSEGSFVGIRAEIKLSLQKEDYIIDRRCIRQWGESVETAQLDPRKPPFNDDMRDSLESTYMEADRDIVQDLRNRRSYFGRVTSSYEMPDEKVRAIEEQLNTINSMIVESVPTLRQTKDRLAAIGETIGDSSSSVEIEPLARKITDLSKGMNIVMKDGNAASFPISQHGSGTRSWISFLTLSAYVDFQSEKRKTDDEEAELYFMLTMEEPEAHLHPQAQRQLFGQIENFTGQKVISTHSPSVVAQATLADAIHFTKRNGKTTAVRYKAEKSLTGQDDDKAIDDKIAREVINTRADILFASAVVLCEGITEELSLPVYFQEYFGSSPFSHGVSFIGIGGLKYKTYLSLIKDFDISWLIFSDGETQAVDSVEKAVRDVFGLDYSALDCVVVLDYGHTYEQYLIHEGYSDAITEAVHEFEEDENYLDTYIQQHNGQKRKKSIAEKLGIEVTRDYTIPSGRMDALTDLCLENKTKYAQQIARRIVAQADATKRVPTKIDDLLSALATMLGAKRASAAEEKHEAI